MDFSLPLNRLQRPIQEHSGGFVDVGLQIDQATPHILLSMRDHSRLQLLKLRSLRSSDRFNAYHDHEGIVLTQHSLQAKTDL